MRRFAPALIAGGTSALLYVIVSALGLGFLFLFLPTLPIFWLGLSRQGEASLHACLVGVLILALFSVPPLGQTLYIAGLVLPAWYIAREALKAANARGHIIWFPLTVIFSRLMMVFSFCLLALSLYYSRIDAGLSAMLAPGLDAATEHLSKEMDGEGAEILKAALPHISFLVFSISAWMWALCLYLHAWAANRELIRQHRATRPQMAVDVLPPPNWMITLMIIAALASFIGSPALAFWGKTSLVMFLFPYFLYGMALFHAYAKKTGHRASLLFFMYFLLGMLIWPVLFVAIYGVIYHLKILNKYLSGGGSSSRS